MGAICGIYKIENLINGKCYIGQSIDIKSRWRQHKSTIFNSQNKNYEFPIYKAIRKYSLNNFSFEILEECDVSFLNEREKYWIQKYDSYRNGYNQDEGGNNASHFIKLSKEKVLEIIEVLKTSNESSEIIGHRFGVSGRTIRAINSGAQSRQSGINYPIRKKLKPISYKKRQTALSKTKENNFCLVCGEPTNNNKYCSQECCHIALRKTERPSREKLKELIRQNSFLKVGQLYSVSDNTIRKWCKNYNLPYQVREIKKISDEDWEKI